MTDLIIRTLARKRLSRLARPSAVLAFALAIAYGGGLWLTLLHHVEGGHERNEPPFVAHWLRDSTLALPLICLAVWVGIVLARKLIARAGASDGPVALCAAVLAAVVALTATLAVGATGPAHGDLFGAEHGGHALTFLAHLGRDMLVALSVNLLLSAAVSAAIFRRRPWAVPDVQSWLAGRVLPRQRLALNSAVALVLVLPLAILAVSGAERVFAQAGAGAPCPAGVPLKTYDVQAIDVDIPLNRFGDHDPQGKMYVLSEEVDRVRREEAARKASIGLRKDAIQPLVIRANIGDCVEINFANNASGGDYGVHIDGLAFDAQNSGDAVGRNASSSVPRGETRSYRFYVPEDDTFEGSHYMRPGPGQRAAVSHGLFGALVVEPRGSTYLAMDDLSPLRSGWEAVIKPEGKKSFREYVQLYHEIGDEDYRLLSASGSQLPRVDPLTESYRPGARAMNYRSEPFMNRLNGPGSSKEEAHGYGSYTFGDPATIIPRSYQGDPAKIRIVNAGSELFHVFHLHGGGIRWRLNPKADPTFDYQDTGLNKHPNSDAPSTRLDSQAFGPGESYELEIEGGAGGVQQGAGEFLFHCHIVEHYVSGMWGFWRVFDTRQPGLAPLPDRAPPPTAVDSAGLIGRTIAGTTITTANLDDWIRPQLPPQGVRKDAQDASVWDWKVDGSDAAAPVYLGEPEDLQSWPDYTKPSDDERLDGHPSLLAGDRPVRLAGEAADRPKILFNPTNGRPAFPLLRPHLGKRPPFSPNGHSGAPYLGETGDQPKVGATDPWAGRADGICPAGAPVKTYNIVTIQTAPVNVTKNVRNRAQIFVLAEDADAVLAGTKPVEPLAIRANIGDCVAVTLTNRIPDAGAFNGFSKTNLHIHHVQFDTQASDGVITGLSYEQSVEDYPSADPQLTAAASTGQRTLRLSSVAKFQPGVAIAVGQGQESIEIRTIESIDAAAGTVTLTRALGNDHAAGENAGTEFVQSRWYPDVQMDNVFFHDHVDGIHGWQLGLVGQLIVEPPGSTYHDPRTGAVIKSGTLADIRTSSPLAKGQVEGSFRELALWQIDDNPVSDSTLNLRAEPWADRLSPTTGNPDPSLLFSSWTHGDPSTPLPRAYQGDPLAIRTINVGPAVDGLKVDGHRFFRENRFLDGQSRTQASPTDSIHYGISERYTAILDGGAGGPEQRTGDFLYFNSLGRRFRQGAWGLLRVLPRQVSDLQPLPGTSVPTGGTPVPTPTGGRPPAAAGAGEPCPQGATTRTVDVSAIDLANPRPGVSSVFVPTADAAAVRNGTKAAEPLVIHVAAGECLQVNFSNERSQRTSFHVSELLKTTASSGVNAGFNPEQTVAPGARRGYRFYADTRKIGAAMISDFGGIDTGVDGLYGAVVVAPSGATFTDPDSGRPVRTGEGVDVHVPGKQGYRDFTTIMSEDDPIIGGNFMPYPVAVAGHATINYRSVPRGDDNAAFSSRANGDPSTPLMRAYAGDPVRVHALIAPGSEQSHVFGLGGQSWRIDPEIDKGNETTAQGMVAWEAFDLDLIGGAGGRQRETGDYFYGDVRRPFTQAGMWGLMRVMSDPACPIRPLDGLDCIGQKSVFTGLPPRPTGNPGDAPAPAAAAPAAGAAQPPAAAATATAAGKPAPKAPLTLRGLTVSRRMRLATLARQGLTFQVTLPQSTRAVRMRLTQRIRGRTRAVAVRLLAVRAGGRRTITWRLKPAQLRRLRAGAAVLEIRAGASSRRLAPAKLKASIRFSGRLPRRR